MSSIWVRSLRISAALRSKLFLLIVHLLLVRAVLPARRFQENGTAGAGVTRRRWIEGSRTGYYYARSEQATKPNRYRCKYCAKRAVARALNRADRQHSSARLSAAAT